MPITAVLSGVPAVGNNPGTLSPALPVGWAAGDLFIVVADGTAGPTAITPDPDYLTFNPNIPLLGRRIATATESAPVLAFPNHNSCIAVVIAFRHSSGWDLVNPIDVIGATAFAPTNTQNIVPAPGIVPTVDDSCVVVYGFKGDDWTSVDVLSGDNLAWAERVEVDTTNGSHCGLVVDTGIWTGVSAPPITPKTFVVNGGAINYSRAKMFSLNPNIAVDVTLPWELGFIPAGSA